jgi:hypothetical protein
MAWRTWLPFPTPDHFLLPAVATTIACEDLLPGDAIVSSDHVQVCHDLIIIAHIACLINPLAT